MVPSRDGEWEGADLVGRVSIGCNAISANDDQIHLFFTHE